MLPPLLQDLIEVTHAAKPNSVVYLAKEKVPALEQLNTRHCTVRHIATGDPWETLDRYDLGVVMDYLEHLPEVEAIQQLCRLRNLHCKRLWVSVQETPFWTLNQMVSMGFKRGVSSTKAAATVSSYHYDIDHYNHKRQWNTPKYWANPENWGKYWW